MDGIGAAQPCYTLLLLSFFFFVHVHVARKAIWEVTIYVLNAKNMLLQMMLASVKDAEEEQAVVLLSYAIVVLVNENSVKPAGVFYRIDHLN